MLIYVDANAIVSDDHLHRDIWEQLAASQARVVTLTLALDEAASRYGPERETALAKLTQSRSQLSPEARGLLDQAIEATHGDIQAYPQWLRRRWGEFGFETLDIPDVSHEMIVERALSRQPPFNAKGGGYRDTLHWLAFLQLAADNPDDDLLLVTSDQDFIDASGSLRRELQEEVDELLGERGTAKSVRLNELVAPGRYRDETVDLSDDGLDLLLLNEIKEGLELSGFSDGIPPANLGIRDADYIDFRHVEALDFVELNARELTADRSLEVRFQVAATVTIGKHAVDVDAEGQSIDWAHEEILRDLLFSGIATAPSSRDEIRLRELSVELHPAFDFAALLERLDGRTIDAGAVERGREALREMLASIGSTPVPRRTTLLAYDDDNVA